MYIVMLVPGCGYRSQHAIRMRMWVIARARDCCKFLCHYKPNIARIDVPTLYICMCVGIVCKLTAFHLHNRICSDYVHGGCFINRLCRRRPTGMFEHVALRFAAV